MAPGQEPAGLPSPPGVTLVEVGVRILGGGEEVVAVSYCRLDGDRLECSMEGDAGNFGIRADGPDRVLVEAGDRGMGFEGDEGFHRLRPDAGDDRPFLLRRCG